MELCYHVPTQRAQGGRNTKELRDGRHSREGRVGVVFMLALIDGCVPEPYVLEAGADAYFRHSQNPEYFVSFSWKWKRLGESRREF